MEVGYLLVELTTQIQRPHQLVMRETIDVVRAA